MSLSPDKHRMLVLGDRAQLEAALADWIVAVKGDDRLRQVVVVTGSNLAGGHLSRAVAGRLGAHAGVRFVSVHALASSLAAGALAAGELRLLSPLLRERLVAGLVARRAGRPWYFAPVAETPGLPRALLRTVDDLREAGVPVAALTAVGSRKGADLAALYGDYVAALQRRRLADDADLYRLAAQAAAGQTTVLAPGVPIAVHGLYDLPAMQADLVAALAGGRSFAAFLPWSAGVGPYVAPAREFYESLGLEPARTGRAGSLAPAPAASVPAVTASGQLTLDLTSPAGAEAQAAPTGASPVSAAAAAASPAGVASPAAALRIVSVADDIAERRAVTAELLRAAGAGLAFHEMAAVAPDRQGRDRLARALRAQGIPVAARGADDGAAARTCRLLLDCLLPVAGRPLRRDAVIDLAATAPRLSPPADAATLALWDDFSRRARIVADQEWRDRLWRLLRSFERRDGHDGDADSPSGGASPGGQSQANPAGHTSSASPSAAASPSVAASPSAAASPSLDSEAAACASLDAFVGRLVKLRRRLLAARSWRQATHAFLEAAQELCGVPPDAPVVAALSELADVSLVDDAGPGDAFAVVAGRALSLLDAASAERVGRDGVAVLSPHELRGLAFRLVVFCDLAEGGFPPRPTPDPVLLDRERALVAAACGARLPGSAELPAEYDALFALACDAAVDELVLLAPRLDTSTGRPRLPSRALLALARTLAARPVAFAELETEGGLDGVVRRVATGLGDPVDVRDLDLRTLAQGAARHAARPAWLGEYAVAVMGAKRTERGAAEASGRRRPALGPHDGVLSAGSAARAAAAVFAAPVSPSAFETYLSCPFAFYLRYVLGLRVPDEPDEALAIEPVDLGKVVHEILQGAYAAAARGGAPTRELALAGLDEIAPRAFARAEARGLTGFPLSWRVVADEVLADLRRVVATDPCWDDGLLPEAFEWSFGGDEAAPLPELQVGQRLVRFRGRIDRVDQDADGRRVRLVDYKTGKGKTEAELVGAGHDVQLPVYVLALLAGAERRAAEVVAEYRMVRRQGGFKTQPLPGDPDEVREGLRTTLAVAVAGIDNGFYPRLPDQQRCKFCDAADACGADRVAFAAKASDPRLRPLLGLEERAAASPDRDAP